MLFPLLVELMRTANNKPACHALEIVSRCERSAPLPLGLDGGFLDA